MKYYIKNVPKLCNISNTRPLIVTKQDVPYFNIDNYIFVDLDLPSGILWASMNIGAFVSKNKESWYGDYYAWGELKIKQDYNWETYIFGGDISYYTEVIKYNDIDGLTFLQNVDNIAYNKNISYTIPDINDFNELINNTSVIWRDNYLDVQGLNGCEFIRNGTSIFLPACGDIVSSTQIGNYEQKLDGITGEYWTCMRNLSLNKSTEARILYFNANGISNDYAIARCLGLPVRHVIKTK